MNILKKKMKGVNNCDKSETDNKYFSPLKQHFVKHHFSNQCYENIPSTVIKLASADPDQRCFFCLYFYKQIKK